MLNIIQRLLGIHTAKTETAKYDYLKEIEHGSFNN